MKARCGYKLDARVAKAAKLVNPICPNYCPCCIRKSQTIDHWLTECPFFNNVRSEFSDDLEPIFNLANRQSTASHSSNENPNSSYNSNSIEINTDNSRLIENNTMEINVYNNNSSVSKKVFKFLLGGRSNNSTREWNELYEGQTKPSGQKKTPFLTVTAALLNKIMPIAIDQQWSMFNRFNFKNTTKSVNAEETVRQASRARANNEDHNFVS